MQEEEKEPSAQVTATPNTNEVESTKQPIAPADNKEPGEKKKPLPAVPSDKVYLNMSFAFSRAIRPKPT